MKIIAVNGSPRKDWNTAQLLKKTLEGAASLGMESELVHLYDLDYKGCISCFACKLKDGPSFRRCIVQDSLARVLDAIREADALVIGSPVYLFEASGQTRSFLERLMFQCLLYTNPPTSIFPHPLKTALIYTMNMSIDMVEASSLNTIFTMTKNMLERAFGTCELLLSTDTLQFKDYSKYDTAYFNAEAKMQRHREIFPRELEQAYALGRKLAQM